MSVFSLPFFFRFALPTHLLSTNYDTSSSVKQGEVTKDESRLLTSPSLSTSIAKLDIPFSVWMKLFSRSQSYITVLLFMFGLSFSSYTAILCYRCPVVDQLGRIGSSILSDEQLVQARAVALSHISAAPHDAEQMLPLAMLRFVSSLFRSFINLLPITENGARLVMFNCLVIHQY